MWFRHQVYGFIRCSAKMLRRLATSFLVGFACLGPLAEGFENMNGDYVVTRTPNAAPGEFNTKWSEYPGGVEYFDVHLGPITSLYAQVWWKNVPAVPLPDDLLRRFDGKGMAIVGCALVMATCDAPP